jgi:hypothetical protein
MYFYFKNPLELKVSNFIAINFYFFIRVNLKDGKTMEYSASIKMNRARILSYMFRKPKKEYASFEISGYVLRIARGSRPHEALKTLIDDGYVKKIQTIFNEKEVERYVLTQKAIQNQRVGIKNNIRIKIPFHHKDEYTVQDVIRDRLCSDHDSIPIILDMLCDEGYLEKKQASSPGEQVEGVYKITSKARKERRQFRRRKASKDAKRSFFRILSNPLLNAILVGFIAIVGGLILMGIIWGILSLFM